jgi:hypothetical protein
MASNSSKNIALYLEDSDHLQVRPYIYLHYLRQAWQLAGLAVAIRAALGGAVRLAYSFRAIGSRSTTVRS